jgi:hypothetical protein
MEGVRAYDVGAKFDHSTLKSEILYAGRSSKAKYVLVGQFCEKPKIRTWRAVKIKIHILFCVDN